MQRKEILEKVRAQYYSRNRREHSEEAEFAKLRASVIGAQKRKLRERLSRNPEMDAIEEKLGVYREELEPQFVAAGWRMAESGLPIRQSGFNENAPQYQMLLMDGTINHRQEAYLQVIHVSVVSADAQFFIHGLDDNPSQQMMTMLEFRPSRPDIAEMTQTWNMIADILIDEKDTP